MAVSWNHFTFLPWFARWPAVAKSYNGREQEPRVKDDGEGEAVIAEIALLPTLSTECQPGKRSELLSLNGLVPPIVTLSAPTVTLPQATSA
jgi:hypothetical protein